MNEGRVSDFSVKAAAPSPKLNTTVFGVGSEPNGLQRLEDEFSASSGLSEVGVSDFTSSSGSLKGISGLEGMSGLR